LKHRILAVGGVEHVVGQEIQGKEVKKPLRGSRVLHIVCKIVQLWWEIVQNMLTVAFRSRIISIMAIFGRKCRASIKISMRILLLVFCVKKKVWNVCKIIFPINGLIFVRRGVLNMPIRLRNNWSGCTRPCLSKM